MSNKNIRGSFAWSLPLPVFNTRKVGFKPMQLYVCGSTTVAEGAELHIEQVPVKILCHACGQQFIVEGNVYVCQNCSSTNVEILAGKEFILESISGDKLNAD